MSTEEEIRYMKVRLVRLALEEWHLTIEQAADLFAQNDVFRYIRYFYGIFHVEWDYAILGDIKSFLRSKGVTVKPRCQTPWFCNQRFENRDALCLELSWTH